MLQKQEGDGGGDCSIFPCEVGVSRIHWAADATLKVVPPSLLFLSGISADNSRKVVTENASRKSGGNKLTIDVANQFTVYTFLQTVLSYLSVTSLAYAKYGCL